MKDVPSTFEKKSFFVVFLKRIFKIKDDTPTQDNDDLFFEEEIPKECIDCKVDFAIGCRGCPNNHDLIEN